jgi:hypothetical protein
MMELIYCGGQDTDGNVLEHGIMAVDTNFLLRTFLPGADGRSMGGAGVTDTNF